LALDSWQTRFEQATPGGFARTITRHEGNADLVADIGDFNAPTLVRAAGALSRPQPHARDCRTIQMEADAVAIEKFQ
jgi:hypothetical protein